MSQFGSQRFKSVRIYCEASAIGSAALGCLVLFGWTFHFASLISVLPGLVGMKGNTASALVLSGISLWLLIPEQSSPQRRHVAFVLSLLVVLVGLGTLCEYLFGLNLHIDELLFHETDGAWATSSPGRMSPISAMAFAAIGTALMLLTVQVRRADRAAQGLSLLAALSAMLALIGYIDHATALYRLLLYTQVALHTAIALLLLSVAVFFVRPRSAFAGDLMGDGSGSVMARHFLPGVFLVPICLGWMSLHGQRAGLYGTELGLALYCTASVVVLAFLVWLNARKINRESDQRNRAEIEIRELNTQLERRVADRTNALEQQTTLLAEQAALLNLTDDSIFVCDMQNRIIFWNKGAAKKYGWEAEEALGRVTHELLKTDFPAPVEQIHAELMSHGRWEGELVHTRADQTRVTVASRWALQRDVRGAPRAILEINNDITERKRTEDELRLSEQRLSLAASVAKVGVWDWCLADNTLTWDATMFEIYGLAPVFPMAYEKWSTAVSAEDLPRVEAVLQKVIAEKSEGFAEFSITRADGAVRNLSAAEKVVLDDDAKVIRVIGVNMDITERKAADELNRIREEQLSHTAHHDFLTGLPNRMLLNDRVNRAIASASRNRKRIAVMFLDLDGFKQINDSLGHLFGDKLLQSIAKRLVDAVRMSDTVSRQGGDEFVVLLSEVAHSEDCAITAQRMLQAVAEPHSIDQNELFVTTSIGIAVYPDHGRDAETLLKNADTAMYHAKENGRQSYHFFEPAIIARAEKRQFDSRPPPDAASF